MRGPGSSRARAAGQASKWQSTKTIGAGILAGVVVLCFIYVLVPAGDGAPAATSHPPTHGAPTKAPADTPASSQASQATATGGPGAGLSSAPSDVTWQLYHSVAIPSSPSAGPTEAGPSVVGGFAHTPEGALIAAVQISVRHALAPNWQAVLAADVAPGPGRSAYAALRRTVSTSNANSAQPGQYLQVAGFSFVGYSPATASVNVVSRSTTTGAMQVITETVVWQGGDWKLELQANGSTGPASIPVSSLAGYIAWAGV